MGVMEDIHRLVKEGETPKELINKGYKKATVYSVYKQEKGGKREEQMTEEEKAKKAEEERKKAEEKKRKEEAEIHYTDPQLKFLNLLKKYGIKTPKSETVVDYIGTQGEDILDSPVRLLEALSDQEIGAPLRRQIIKHWFSDKHIDIPPDILTSAGLDKKEAEADARERAAAKYVYETETGQVRMAREGERGGTLEQARELKRMAQEEKEKADRALPVMYVYDPETGQVRMAREGERGGTLEQAKELKRMAQEEKEQKGKDLPALYVYDTESGQVRMAKEGERGGTLEQAKELKRMAPEKEQKGGELPVQYVYETETGQVRMAREEERGGTLEQAKELKRIAGTEKEGRDLPVQYVYEPESGQVRLAKEGERGGTLEQAKELKRMAPEKEEKGRGLPEWLQDPAAFLKTISELSGGRQAGSDDMKQEISALKQALVELKEQQYKQAIDAQQEQIKTLSGKLDKLVDYVSELRKPVTGTTEMDILREIATEGINVIKTELPGLRGDVKAALQSTDVPAPKTEEEKEKRKETYRSALKKDKELEELGQKVFFT